MDSIGEYPLPHEILTTIKVLGRKWALPILHELTHEPLGFGELKNNMEGISASVLSNLIIEFMENDILEKKTVSVNPERHLYFITDFGQVLCDIIESLSSWGSKLIEKQKNKTTIENLE